MDGPERTDTLHSEPDHAVSRGFADPASDALEESQPVPSTTVTLVEGSSFIICGLGGDIGAGGVEGLFVGDTRICSEMMILIDGEPVEPLTCTTRSPSSASFVGRTSDRRLLVFKDLLVGQGLRVDLRVRNLTGTRRSVEARLIVSTDLADVFAVKTGAPLPVHTRRMEADGELTLKGDGIDRGVLVRAPGTSIGAGFPGWRFDLEPRDEWETCVEIKALEGDDELPLLYPCGQPSELAAFFAGQAAWKDPLSDCASDLPTLNRVFDQARKDLGALRLIDPAHPRDTLIAAGAPWYMTLFGRDSVITSLMAMVLDPDLGLGIARTLARTQGRHDVSETGEQPGRMLHEARSPGGSSLRLSEAHLDFGAVDTTPLFVMLVHELSRWGVPPDEIRALQPAVDASLAWLEGPGDADGDGYVEYGRPDPWSHRNQGWKDSPDAVSFADGRLAEPPIALAEVQAYAYAAWIAGATLASIHGHESTASSRRARAEELRRNFERDFWLPDREAFAIALDRDKRPVDAIASNMGHCLWAGIVDDPEKAAAVARWLVSPDLFSGWGIRTLATSMGRYSPLTYHNGSVWPHDTAIAVAGLRRYGFVDEANRVALGLLGAAEALGGRLPELFGGLMPSEMPVPVRYPTACSPQAWASAAPLLLVRAFLGLEPDVPAGRVELDPVLPDGATRLHVADLPLAGSRVAIEVDGDAVAVRGLPRGLAVVRPTG